MDGCGEEEGTRERKRGPRRHRASYRHCLWRKEDEREKEEREERERALGGSQRGQCRSEGVGGSIVSAKEGVREEERGVLV
jgi:hypothetical protein